MGRRCNNEEDLTLPELEEKRDGLEQSIRNATLRKAFVSEVYTSNFENILHTKKKSADHEKFILYEELLNLEGKRLRDKITTESASLLHTLARIIDKQPKKKME